MTHFTTFIGVDQTGATDSKGQPKPLPVAVLYKDGSQWELRFSNGPDRLEIPSVGRAEILDLLKDFPLPGRDLSRTALILDSVFGLPEKHWPFSQGGSEQLFRLFKRAFEFSYQGKAFGRNTAEKFFSEFLSDHKGPKLPRRQCEIQSGANSIFLTRPFQRNIGCGTFRIWKELGRAPEKWFQVWGFDEPALHVQDGPWLVEAYPTLFWKKILGFSSRKPADLIRWLKTEAPLKFRLQARQCAILMDDPDLCDSVVLAIGAWILQERSEMWQIPANRSLKKEGWILGL